MNPQQLKALNDQDWSSIILKLYAHSLFRLRWFGLTSETRLQGRDYKDFAHEAVTLLYEGKRVWKPLDEPDIAKYLKSVINSLISNLLKSKENRALTDADLTEEINDVMLFNDMFQQKLINKDLLDTIEDTLVDDEDMWLVFTDLAKGMTPLDISEKYDKMEIEKVRKIQKRLQRHIRNIKNL
jgi:hypothetical protein